MSDVRTTPCVRGSPRAGVPTADPSPHRHDSADRGRSGRPTRGQTSPAPDGASRESQTPTGARHGPGGRLVARCSCAREWLAGLLCWALRRTPRLLKGRARPGRPPTEELRPRSWWCGESCSFGLLDLVATTCMYSKGNDGQVRWPFRAIFIGLLPNTRTQATVLCLGGSSAVDGLSLGVSAPSSRHRSLCSYPGGRTHVHCRPVPRVSALSTSDQQRSELLVGSSEGGVEVHGVPGIPDVSGWWQVGPGWIRCGRDVAVPGGRGDQHLVTVARQG